MRQHDAVLTTPLMCRSRSRSPARRSRRSRRSRSRSSSERSSRSSDRRRRQRERRPPGGNRFDRCDAALRSILNHAHYATLLPSCPARICILCTSLHHSSQQARHPGRPCYDADSGRAATGSADVCIIPLCRRADRESSLSIEPLSRVPRHEVFPRRWRPPPAVSDSPLRYGSRARAKRALSPEVHA